MKSIIQQLRILNDVDLKLRTVRKDLERIPKEIKDKEEEPRLVGEQIERRKAEVVRLQGEIESLDEELKLGETALKRYSSQMSILRTPKEFESVKRSIDAQKQNNKQTEAKTLELMGAADALQKEIGELETRLKELNAALDLDRQAAEKDLGELRADNATLGAQRATLAREIPGKELGIYDRIVVSRGDAIANVKKGGICSACYMGLPPQTHNLALLAKELVTCPSCGRILTAE
ncbi:MAG: C4-type zinc ribbon domain-containing protein [Planctomycetota bacterium]|nr:C4-type zinc ribbon domain-containing protein [Planctomycetota bacterium]